MDERTLNDLLECSVCLERLDTSSKVLPCQHTFCKKCLEDIFHTNKELRCPECRVLVEIGIDGLPPNVLLMRILEGMRNVPRRTSTAIHSYHSETVTTADTTSKPTISAQSSHLRIRSRSANTQVPLTADLHQPHAIATYDCVAKEPGDLSFKRGDLILLRRKIDNNWYQGECNGVLGVFPLPYVQVMVPLPSHVPQCKALYDFNKCHEDDEGCLHFSKGDVITVIRRIDENWAEGKLEDRIGIFPITFVEMNYLAKNIMKNNFSSSGFSRDPPPTPADETTPSLTSVDNLATLTNNTNQNIQTENVGSPSSSSSSASTATTSPTSSSESTTPSSPSASPSTVQSVQNVTTKRHSFTLGAQPPPYQAPPAVHRHSVEILKPEESGIASEIKDDIHYQRYQSEQRISQQVLQLSLQSPLVHLDDSLTRQSYHGKKPQNEQIDTSREPQSLCLPTKQVNGKMIENFQRQSSLRISKNSPVSSKLLNSPALPAMYIAIYPYKPQKSDELELKIGSVYTVIERCQDGWYKGTSHPNQKCGVFPGNYVTPVKALPMLQAQLRGLIQAPASPRDTRVSTSDTRPSVPFTKPNFVTTSSPNVTQSSSNTRLAPPELPTRSVSPILASTTSQKNSTIWHVSNPDSIQDKLVTSTVTSTKHRSKNENVENNESVVSSDSVQKSNSGKVVKTSDRGKDKKEKGSVSLMRRLTSIKKSRSPPPATSLYSIDNPMFDDSSFVFTEVAHVRSDSCPSQLTYSSHSQCTSSINNHASAIGGSQRVKHKERSSLQNHFSRTFDSSSASVSNSKLTKDEKPVVSHRKSSSLDATVYEDKHSHKSKSIIPPPRERYRCIAPYPPNSEFELELRVDDIIYVHKKREDGWYKGTLQRNGRTGLFPASFVESA